MSSRYTRSQRDAIALFKDFREMDPGNITKVKLSIPKHVIVMGHLDMIGYRTSHGRTGRVYTHDFAPGSRPLLCAGTNPGELFIVGGNFHVTDRGIVDLDKHGEEIDDDSERYD